jgi:hypothetical protein
MLGGGGIAEHDDSAVFGGGGIAEHDDSAIFGGGGTAEHDDSAIFGGGGIADPDRAVAGGGGIGELLDSVILGGGGMAEQEASVVRGGGGIADPDRAVTGGGGGITDPERAGPPARADPNCPAGLGTSRLSMAVSARNSASCAALVPNSIPSILRPIRPFGNPLRPHPPRGFMIVARMGQIVSLSGHDHESVSSDVQTITRVRSPRNRSRAYSSGSPERA